MSQQIQWVKIKVNNRNVADSRFGSYTGKWIVGTLGKTLFT